MSAPEWMSDEDLALGAAVFWGLPDGTKCWEAAEIVRVLRDARAFGCAVVWRQA